MRTSIIQMDIDWGNPLCNIKRADALIESAPDADLYVLPEMFSTGFATEPEGIAESEDCATLQWMKDKSRQRNAAIAGSIAMRIGAKYYNRLFFVKPDGIVTAYDKRHLFSYAGEHNHYTRGKSRVIVEWRGVRIMLQVCYDIRFPVFCRNRKDYDMILFVAAWPESRIGVWDTLLRARALENQCYVAGVNRIGSDPKCRYNGHSAIISPYGETLAECKDNEQGTAFADIDMDRLAAFRHKFPVLDDADIIYYNDIQSN